MSLLKNKKSIVLIFLFSILTISSTIFIFAKNYYQKINNELETKILRDANYTKDKYLIEGKYIWEITNLNKDEVNYIIKKKSPSRYLLFVIIDSVQCFSCLEFHDERLNEISKFPTRIIGLSDRYKQFFKTTIDFNAINSSRKLFINKTIEKKFIISIVDEMGRIIYVDFPSPYRYSESRAFYGIVKRYLE
ncbi:MAG: hypothetical protein FD143_3207 [Ignavibacteria bacterium]|nr:MAG: hypothetical protein FD143_3207 [Ignavibacteria bacterium]KAF0153941.1 MAG: hypothetical protein FD188_3320 [Ignavibacteria bacterium]